MRGCGAPRKNCERRVSVNPDPLKRAGMLKPGRAVFVIGPKRPDGTVAASNVTVESKGVKPPM